MDDIVCTLCGGSDYEELVEDVFRCLDCGEYFEELADYLPVEPMKKKMSKELEDD